MLGGSDFVGHKQRKGGERHFANYKFKGQAKESLIEVDI